MLHHFTTNNTKHTKIHLVTAEPPFTVKRSTGCTRQDLGSCCLLPTCCVNQDCHGVGHCVKDGSLSLSESQWTVLMAYLTITTNVSDAIKYSTDDNFSFSKIAMCVQHSPTAAALLTNTAFKWKIYIFVFPRFARYIRSTSCLQGFDIVGWAAGRASGPSKNGGCGVGHCLVRMEWHPSGWSMCLPLFITYWTIKSRSCLLAPVVVWEAQVIWGGILKHLLIAYFISNISAKKKSKSVHVCQSCSKP